MAKIRVHELAKELNMKHQVLMDKLTEMNISVKSHMSPLEDGDVMRIREEMGKAQADMNGKSVVLRRKKRPTPKKSEKPVQESVSLPSEKTPPEIPFAEKQEPEQESAAVKPDAIVSGDADVKPVAIVAEHRIPEPDFPPQSTAPVTPPPETPEAFDSKKFKRDDSQRTGKPTDQESKDRQPSASATDRPLSTRQKRRRARKAKKDMPAKIIKMPEPEQTAALLKTIAADKPKPPVEPVYPKKPVVIHQAERRVDSPLRMPEPLPIIEKEQRKKKWKKTSPGIPDIAEDKKFPKKKVPPVIDTVEDKKFFKKKISFKRKEVIEADVLYDDVRRERKSRKQPKAKPTVQPQKPQLTVPKAIKRRLKIDDTIVLSDLAKRMGIKANEMIAKLMGLGVMATVNQTIDFDTALLVAAEFGFELERAAFEEEVVLKTSEDDPSKMLPRPPVVTIMGHVDHGKTSLLDVIRKTKITEIEAGGITQHIGAYHVKTNRGQVVFLDTPGHEAFTAMRARGAKVTDIVVLVVAADDGVMPQTIEAINHSKAAGVPILVAVNKIDKPNADPDRVIRQLADLGLVPEDWGGDTIYVKVSAKQNIGIDQMLEMILLQSEVLELKANPNKMASGYVIEAKLDSGRGPVATVMVKEGTLRNGDAVVCGVFYGRVRAMLNDRGKPVESAGPSIPVEVLGLSGVPNAGDELIALEDEKTAKQVSLHRIQKQRAKELAKTSRLSLEKLFEKMKQGEVKDLNLILKADVHGSIEALRDSLIKLSNEEVTIRVIHAATGTITESDVSLAAVSNAIIIGFNVRPTPKVQALANEEHVDMRFYNIIYNVIKDIQDAIVGMMKSTFEERVLGRALVREVFHISKVGTIAGCGVTDGKIQRGKSVRLLRDGVVLYEGKISSLKRFKDDAKEVLAGFECGIGLENYNDIKVGDEIECYYLEEIKPEVK